MFIRAQTDLRLWRYTHRCLSQYRDITDGIRAILTSVPAPAKKENPVEDTSHLSGRVFTPHSKLASRRSRTVDVHFPSDTLTNLPQMLKYLHFSDFIESITLDHDVGRARFKFYKPYHAYKFELSPESSNIDMISVSKTSEPDDRLPVDVISAILSRGASRNVMWLKHKSNISLPHGTYSTQTPDGLLVQFLDIKDAIKFVSRTPDAYFSPYKETVQPEVSVVRISDLPLFLSVEDIENELSKLGVYIPHFFWNGRRGSLYIRPGGSKEADAFRSLSHQFFLHEFRDVRVLSSRAVWYLPEYMKRGLGLESEGQDRKWEPTPTHALQSLAMSLGATRTVDLIAENEALPHESRHDIIHKFQVFGRVTKVEYITTTGKLAITFASIIQAAAAIDYLTNIFLPSQPFPATSPFGPYMGCTIAFGVDRNYPFSYHNFQRRVPVCPLSPSQLGDLIDGQPRKKHDYMFPLREMAESWFGEHYPVKIAQTAQDKVEEDGEQVQISQAEESVLVDNLKRDDDMKGNETVKVEKNGEQVFTLDLLEQYHDITREKTMKKEQVQENGEQVDIGYSSGSEQGDLELELTKDSQ